jgi:hypothetical protein
MRALVSNKLAIDGEAGSASALGNLLFLNAAPRPVLTCRRFRRFFTAGFGAAAFFTFRRFIGFFLGFFGDGGAGVGS